MTLSTSRFRNFSRQNFEIGFVSRKVGESFNSKSASNSRSRPRDELPRFAAGGRRKPSSPCRNWPLRASRLVFSAPARPLSVLMMSTSSFFRRRISRSGCKRGSVRSCSETRTRFIRLGIRPAGQRVLLRLAHFRRGDHLHRLGDLRGVADRLDPAADVLRVRHIVSVYCQVALKSFERASPIAPRDPCRAASCREWSASTLPSASADNPAA